LRFADLGQLTFEAPDEDRFPALRLARAALQAGGSTPIVLNAANEIAVEAFLCGRIGFLDIARVVEETMTRITASPLHAIADVVEVDGESRQVATELTAALPAPAF
jgi:1-deoxy-D-xylulose-5-phosphate reductoisomerase